MNKVTLLRAAVWIFASFLIVITLIWLITAGYGYIIMRDLVQPPHCTCFGPLEWCGPLMEKCYEAMGKTPTPTPPWWQFWNP